jgi:hypothetical protein
VVAIRGGRGRGRGRGQGEVTRKGKGRGNGERERQRGKERGEESWKRPHVCIECPYAAEQRLLVLKVAGTSDWKSKRAWWWWVGELRVP